MREKKERLLLAFGEVDDKYIKEAESKMTMNVIKIAVCAVLLIAVSLFLFLPFAEEKSVAQNYKDSNYYPLIETLEAYRINQNQGGYKNYFEYITGSIGDMFSGGFAKGDMVTDMNGAAGGAAPEMGADGGNGNYVEATDNQVEGVIESDLFKMTDKYIFRIGYTDRGSGHVLRVYSIDKENSALISEINIPQFDGEQYFSNMEIYLSADASTLTVLKNYNGSNGMSNIGVISLDVSDVNNITAKGMVSIQGLLNTSRMVDGKLLLVTEYYFNRNKVDYDDPATYVPTIDRGEGPECIKFEDIIYPEEIDNTRYSVVALLDEENLTLLGANALLNFTNEVYISENNLFISRQYTEKHEEDKNTYTTNLMSEIAVLGYSDGHLEKKGTITVNGSLKDQYSFDEKDGYLRVVTSTERGEANEYGESVGFSSKQNVSLYIFNLQDNSLAYSVEDFAIEGEEATAVRFNGDKLYVCTAEVIKFTDPVYFFDLTDYENIEFSDTGIIDGYSTSLIDLGEGFLLGIGQENWEYSKVEVYEEQSGSVVSVDEFKFVGSYSTDYKAYLVNREENLFGFAVDYYYEDSNDTEYSQCYILLQFNGYELNVVAAVDIEEMRSHTARAAFIDGYLYITTTESLTVERVFEQ